MKTITGYFIDPANAIAEPRTIKWTPNGFYTLLRCDCFDITARKLGDRYFEIMCDDEGLLKDHPVISAYDVNEKPMFVGPLFVLKFNGKDDIMSLNEDDLAYVANYVKVCWSITTDGESIAPVLTNLRYR